MKKAILLTGFLALVLMSAFYNSHQVYASGKMPVDFRNRIDRYAGNDELKSGDLIFQTSLTAQSKAIQLATRSIYSHCGIIYKVDTGYVVFEAVQPVKITPLAEWIARGKDGKFVIKRLKNADQVLTPSAISKMKQAGDPFMGKNYDLTFEWTDDKIYCSELVWKVYQRGTGVEIAKLEKIRDFDLTNEVVMKMLHERYGNDIPLDATIISPAAIFNSELLMTVKSNY
jgi:uncharacterized protein YycO